jgi:hypothetical protein
VERRLLFWGLGLGTFIVTFALSSWHAGLWHSAHAPAPPVAAPHYADSTVSAGAAAAHAVAATAAPDNTSAVEPPRALPQADTDADSTRDLADDARADRSARGGERGARTH